MGFKVTKWQIQLSLIAIATVLLIVAVNATRAQTEPERYFPETGHTARGLFLQYFDAHGGLAIFGYPITEEIVENNRVVQYFQRARFEWWPENAEGSRVQLGNLAEELGYTQPRLPANQIPAPGNPYCAYFAETGHSVCNAFLTYFREQGGVAVFGYPISEYYTEKDRIVQYFQRARMEWHPEKPYKVQLSNNLGLIAFRASDNPEVYLTPQPPAAGQYAVTRLSVLASVNKSITGRLDRQTVYVVVTDQQNQPVSGALATITVRLSSGESFYALPLTDKNGQTSFTFDFAERPGETVEIVVSATSGSLTTNTRTSYLAWW